MLRVFGALLGKSVRVACVRHEMTFTGTWYACLSHDHMYTKRARMSLVPTVYELGLSAGKILVDAVV